jgi:cytochrome c-type biogenesis protein CcmH
VSLWPLIALVTLAVVAVIIWPLVKPRRIVPPGRAAFDRAIYRDQLAEIQRDLERGVLAPAQAEAARLEIERRLLATESADRAAESTVASAPVDGVTVVMLACFISAGAVALYLALGSPKLKDQPFASRADASAVAQDDSQAPADLASSLASLEAKLKEHPDDAEGWLLLARTQGVLQRWSDAAQSYLKAIALTQEDAEAEAGYGEMLVKLADNQVTPAAREAFAKAIAKDPADAASRFYLALGDAQAGKAKEAVAAWTKLVDDAPPGTEWVDMVRGNIKEVAQRAGIAVPKEAERPPTQVASTGEKGPNAADVAAAAQMTPDERQQMIRGMVEGLAARLKDNPNDLAGWQRLANAYRVLGEEEKAKEAAAHVASLQSGAPSAQQPPVQQSPAPAASSPGPSAADMAAAAQMTPEQRQQMIRGMVEGLAARLKDNPGDLAGWQRLANAYRVLGEEERAKDALAHVAALSPNDVTPLLAEAHRILARGEGRDPKQKLPDRLVELMKEVEQRDPKQPEALWYLGLAEAQNHNGAAAAVYWQRLLALLDPASDDYKMVQAAVDAVKKN